MSTAVLPEALAKLACVVAEDDDLQAWFLSLDETPSEQRALELREVAARMRAAGEHPELIEATELLALPAHYLAVRDAVREAIE